MNRPLDLLKGAADVTRLRILALLARRGGDLCVCQIQGALGESQTKISRHLKILRQSGWLREQRRGRWVHYVLLEAENPFHHQLIEAMGQVSPEFLALIVPFEQIETLKRQNLCAEEQK